MLAIEDSAADAESCGQPGTPAKKMGKPTGIASLGENVAACRQPADGKARTTALKAIVAKNPVNLCRGGGVTPAAETYPFAVAR